MIHIIKDKMAEIEMSQLENDVSPLVENDKKYKALSILFPFSSYILSELCSFEMKT